MIVLVAVLAGGMLIGGTHPKAVKRGASHVKHAVLWVFHPEK